MNINKTWTFHSIWIKNESYTGGRKIESIVAKSNKYNSKIIVNDRGYASTDGVVPIDVILYCFRRLQHIELSYKIVYFSLTPGYNYTNIASKLNISVRQVKSILNQFKAN